MRLNELTPCQLSSLYHEQLQRDFPPQELKPLDTMLTLQSQGRYQALGLYEGEQLLGYALLWLEPGVPFVLLDYLGTLPGIRNRGLGGQMLDLLAEHFRDVRGIFGEVEEPEGGDPAGEALRRRRLAFYLRHGFRYGGYNCALFGIRFRTLIRGREDVTAQELLEVHQRIYRRHLSPATYQRCVQLPLAPGQQPGPPVAWTEE